MKINTVFLISILLIMIFSGCAFNINNRIGPFLDPVRLNDKCGTEKIDLAEGGKCDSGTLSVNLISAWPKTPFSRKFSGRSNCDSFNERELLC